MFYFDYGVSPSVRLKAVGANFDTQELTRQIVFLLDGRVIDNEFLPTDIEKPIQGQIAFEDPVQNNSNIPFTCDYQAQFRVTYDDFGAGIPFYELRLVR